MRPTPWRPALVLFDMDDVLCDYDRPARAAHFARLAGRSIDEVLAAIWTSGFETLADRGAIDGDAYVRGCGERIGAPITLDDWVESRRLGTRARPEVLALAASVRQRARIAVLTNNSDLVAQHADRIFPELPTLFGRNVVTSGRLGAMKPDHDCYVKCAALLGVDPAEVLFIDDLEPNVDGARRAGMRAWRYEGAAALRELLRGQGLL